jgi:hypothetical protein
MDNKNFIPKGDIPFNEWQGTLISYAKGKLANWNIPQEDFDELVTLQTAFARNFNTAENRVTRTRATVWAKTSARQIYEKEMRLFIREHLTYNRRVANTDRVNMQLPIHDKIRTRAPLLTARPSGHVDFSVHQQHTMHVRESTEKRRADHAYGFEVWSKIGGERPLGDNDFQYAGFSTSTSLKLKYLLQDVGKTVYYRVRWVNRHHQPGPWSETIITAVIA